MADDEERAIPPGGIPIPGTPWRIMFESTPPIPLQPKRFPLHEALQRERKEQMMTREHEHDWSYQQDGYGRISRRCACGVVEDEEADTFSVPTSMGALNTIAQLEQQLAQLRAERDTLLADLRQRQAGQTSAEQQLAQAREQAKKANTAMFDMRDVIGKEEQTIATLRGEIDRLHLLMDPNKSGVSAVLAANREMESLHQQLHEAQRDFSRMAEERVKQNEAAIKQDETIEFLHIVIDDVKAQNAAMRALLEALTATEPVWESDTGYYYCLYCEPGIGRPMETFQHKDDCPWLKAGALLGKEEER